MGSRKTTLSYYFSVEGETEKWYLERIQELINSSEMAAYTVKFIVKVQKDPRKMVKALTFFDKITICHLCDIEGNSKADEELFKSILDNMQEACKMGKNVTYVLGYCNFAFDLWIALHKCDCNTPFSDRKQYLRYLNSGFKERFSSMDEYKGEKDFKRSMEKITLKDVITAIERAEKIMDNNKANGYKPVKYKKFSYYTVNPSLSVHEIIADILKQCKLLSEKQKV